MVKLTWPDVVRGSTHFRFAVSDKRSSLAIKAFIAELFGTETALATAKQVKF